MFDKVKLFFGKVLKAEDQVALNESTTSVQPNTSNNNEPKIKRLKKQVSYRKQAKYR